MPQSPCSVPRALRLLIPYETPAQQAACRLHDVAYARGGTRRARALADVKLLLRLLRANMDVDRAQRYYTAVRMFGKPHWGDGRYTDDPPDAPAAAHYTATPEAA